MDRLVAVDAKELELIFKPSERCSASFRITNLMHTMSVAISLSAANSVYSFSPHAFSVLPPLSSATYSLNLAPSPSHPPPPDAVILRSTMLPTGRASPDALCRIFSSPGRQIFRDAVLPISLVGPFIVKWLFSSTSPKHFSENTLQSAFLLSKAISRCSLPELSSLLRDAARLGSLSLIPPLIDAGADPNSRGSDGNSALSVAVDAGNVEVARALVSLGATFEPSIDRFLHRAAAANDLELLSLLANSGDINSANSTGRTAIHEAASRGHVEAVRLCCDAGGDVNRADAAGWTPLHYAAAGGHLAVVEFLLDAAPRTKFALTRNGKTPFSLAVDGEHFQLQDALRLGDALHRAAGVGDVDGIRSYLSQGAKVNGRDQNGWTPLHRAAFKGRMECVKLLISSGAHIDPTDDKGYTPLRCAVEAGRADVAMYLVGLGAHVEGPVVRSEDIGLDPQVKAKLHKAVKALTLDCTGKKHPALLPFAAEKEGQFA